jgi:hypothetical protein
VDDACIEECEACWADSCGGHAAEGFWGGEDDLEEAEAVGWGSWRGDSLKVKVREQLLTTLDSIGKGCIVW